MLSLRLNEVTKRFGQFTAVNNLSFAVEAGRIFGFLGGNGAGKTTSLRMVLDIIRPSSGTIEVLGGAPGRKISNSIGFLPEERGLYRQMTALDTIVYFGRLKGMTTHDARQGARLLLDRFGLAANGRTTVDKLSKGMAQKVQLATAVVNRPQLLILDEPFSGLDPVNQGLLEEEIKHAANDGAAVVFSTHVMQHAERLCDRLLLLGRGVKRFEGTLEEARRELPARLVVVAQEGFRTVSGVKVEPGGQEIEPGWFEWHAILEAGITAQEVLEACTRQSIPLRRFEEQQPSLHDVFLHLVGAEGQN